MVKTLRIQLSQEHGLSLISVLATAVVVALLAALAIPHFTAQSGGRHGGQAQAATTGAEDAQAKLMLETAQTAMQSYAGSNGDGYTAVSPSALNSLEPTLILSSATAPYLASASGTSTTYTVTVIDPATRNMFMLADDAGVLTRSCTAPGSGGCPPGGAW